MFAEEREQEIISASKRGVSNAANNFQWNLIKGILANTDEPLIVINALPVGTWPKNFKTFHLKDTDWSCGNIVGHEVGWARKTIHTNEEGTSVAEEVST